MTVSIIIAVKTWQKNLEECVNNCQVLDYPDFEIIIVPDKKINRDLPGVKIIPSGEVSPAEKRDLASRYAWGEILAFIDDDVYPQKSWLKNAMKNFENPEVVAVGGPAITPPEDSIKQIASGRVYENILTSGPYTYRYKKDKKRYVDDYPSCNFLIRKEIFDKLGGFDTKFWPGEDTKLCLEIVHRLKKKILYDPEVIVYHHRRQLFLPHLKQIASYALHRGYFAKKYSQTSLRLSYFLPSIFLLAMLSGLILSLFSLFVKKLFVLFLLIYLGIVFIFSFDKNLKMTFLVFPGIILSHITYGIFFFKGLFAKKLKEEERAG